MLSGIDRTAQGCNIVCNRIVAVKDSAANHHYISTVTNEIANIVQVNAAIDFDVASWVEFTQQVTHTAHFAGHRLNKFL